MTIRLDPRSMTSGEVTYLVRQLGGPRTVSRTLGVSAAEIESWCEQGLPRGPVAGCLRLVAKNSGVADQQQSLGECRICARPAVREVAQTLLCHDCAKPARSDFLRHGFELLTWGSQLVVESSAPFEGPVHASFRKQSGRANDPEVDDEVFDASVLIETADYEVLFDVMQVARRRQTILDLTRWGRVTLDVNEITMTPDERFVGSPDIPPRLFVLAWSLVNETISY